MPTHELFEEDAATVDEPAAASTRAPWSAPGGGEPAPRERGEWRARLSWKWSSWSRNQRIGVVVAAAFLGLLALNAYGSSRQNDTAAAPPPSSAPATTAGPGPTTTTAPERTLVEKQAQRQVDDPLRGLPDLHYMVVAYAGAAPDRFSNVVRVAMAGGANPCNLWLGVDAEGWRVVPADGTTVYPNDFFPVRVFVSQPCPAMAGIPDPQVKPA